MQLYIGGLKEFSQEKEIEEYLSQYGKVQSLKIYNSYGFVTVDEVIGNKILEDTHEMNGNKIIIETAKGHKGNVSEYNRRYIQRYKKPTIKRVSRLIIENLPKNIDWSELRSFILMSGARPTYLRILPSGDGLLEFINRQDRDIALDRLNNQNFYGKNICARFGRKRSDIISGVKNNSCSDEISEVNLDKK
ncbi:splicing factor, arginine/serine-rich 4/5/6 [Nematocida sp. ERTm5]|nr:splicing factor, arginine/serine-rich 4/5/6 [Nematocida sp. ERTm5]